MIHCQAAATRETTPFGFSRQWRRLRALRAAAAMWLAARNLVSWMIDEAREGAVWSDGPAMLDVCDCDGIKIQRIGVLPVDAEITADVFAVGSDSHPPPIIDVSHSGAVAAGLLWRELPGLALIAGIRGNAGPALGILIIASDNNDGLFVRASDGEDSG